MFYFKDNIDLPPLPAPYEKSLLDIYKNEHSNHPHYISGKGEYKIKKVPDLVHNWVKKNVCSDYRGLGVQSIEYGDFEPHVDGRNQIDLSERYFTLMYLLKTGGDELSDPVTRFYELAPGVQIPTQDIDDTRLFDLKDLTLVTECKFKKHTWNLINNRAIHSVDNVKSTRIAMAINFITPTPQSLIARGYI